MIFYLLAGHIATLFLSLNLTTTLQFEEPIEKVIYGGVSQDIYSYLSDDKKTLVLKPFKEIDSNLTLISNNGRSYLFYLKIDPLKPHVFAEIKEGRVNDAYEKVFSHADFDLYQGENSLMVTNKKSETIVLNGIEIKTKGYLSKGVPVIYHEKRVYR